MSNKIFTKKLTQSKSGSKVSQMCYQINKSHPVVIISLIVAVCIAWLIMYLATCTSFSVSCLLISCITPFIVLSVPCLLVITFAASIRRNDEIFIKTYIWINLVCYYIFYPMLPSFILPFIQSFSGLDEFCFLLMSFLPVYVTIGFNKEEFISLVKQTIHFVKHL